MKRIQPRQIFLRNLAQASLVLCDLSDVLCDQAALAITAPKSMDRATVLQLRGMLLNSFKKLSDLRAQLHARRPVAEKMGGM